MAKVTFGALVTEARNKLGAVVYSRNKHGAYTRALIVPPDPKTLLQQNIRTLFKQAHLRWSSTLTDAQRSAWNALAANHRPRTGHFAPLAYSGQQLFQKVNASSLWNWGDTHDAPPTNSDVTDPGPLLPGNFQVSAGELLVTITTPPLAGEKTVLFASKPLNPGRTSPWPTTHRIAELLHGDPATINLWSAYVHSYPQPPPGKRIVIHAWTTRQSNGAHSLRCSTSAILVPETDMLLTQKTVITSAQLLALYGNPVALVPGQGTHTKVMPIAFTIEYVPGTTAYTVPTATVLAIRSLDDNNNLYTFQTKAGGALDMTILTPKLLATMNGGFQQGNPNLFWNKGLQLFQSGGVASMTLGDGTLEITITFTTTPLN